MDESNIPVIADAKSEYITQLTRVLTPHIFEGIISIFKDAKNIVIESNEEDKILNTFQLLLSNIPKWTQEIIDDECTRITSKCDWLEDLLTAIIICQTKILTAIRTNNSNKKINIKIPKLDHFIHRCYIQTARELWKNPYLFNEQVTRCEYQKNMRECNLLIDNSINEVIRKQLPVRTILKEYLGDLYEEEQNTTNITDEEYLSNNNLKNLVKREIDAYFMKNDDDETTDTTENIVDTIVENCKKSSLINKESKKDENNDEIIENNSIIKEIDDSLKSLDNLEKENEDGENFQSITSVETTDLDQEQESTISLDDSKTEVNEPEIKLTDESKILLEQSEVNLSSEPQITLEEPKISLEEPNISLVESQTSSEKPKTSLEEPKISLLEPQTSSEEPQTSSEEPKIFLEDPKTSLEEPEPKIILKDSEPTILVDEPVINLSGNSSTENIEDIFNIVDLSEDKNIKQEIKEELNNEKFKPITFMSSDILKESDSDEENISLNLID